MSELQLKPEFENGPGAATPRGLGSADDASASTSARDRVQGRGVRRRFGAARLRLPTDDGFHLFRVY
jgi:hypothetical protein